jgi:hypothetical protein
MRVKASATSSVSGGFELILQNKNEWLYTMS